MKLASLLVAALAVLALPLIAATPARCADPCEVVAFSGGYLAPVVEIASGTTLTWTSLDIGHVQAEVASDACFIQNWFKPTMREFRFDILSSGLVATGDGATRTCETATMLPDGGALLAYHCVLHPTMRGEIIIAR